MDLEVGSTPLLKQNEDSWHNINIHLLHTFYKFKSLHTLNSQLFHSKYKYMYIQLIQM